MRHVAQDHIANEQYGHATDASFPHVDVLVEVVSQIGWRRQKVLM